MAKKNTKKERATITFAVIYILMVGLLSGCGLFSLEGWIIPDDIEFINTIKELDTPEKICTYMTDNFEWVSHFSAYSPYQMWLANVKSKAGDCNDMSCFAVFVAHYHGYEVYQIRIRESFFWYHWIGVFVEGGKYTSSNNTYYYSWRCETFRQIVNIHRNDYISYEVYDYENNLIGGEKKDGKIQASYYKIH